MPRIYETLYIIHPDLFDEKVNQVRQRVETAINSSKGRIVFSEDWGIRKLAYDVKKCQKGHFVLTYFEGDGETVKELERNFKLMEDVIRYLTIIPGKLPDFEMLEKKSAERSRRAEERNRDDRPAPPRVAPRQAPKPAEPQDKPQDNGQDKKEEKEAEPAAGGQEKEGEK